jgi:hypothetical protein
VRAPNAHFNTAPAARDRFFFKQKESGGRFVIPAAVMFES